jgi:carbonic anhydrase
MSQDPVGRVDIVPQGESHIEVRLFEGESEARYRSWSLPLNTAEAVTRWWLGHSPSLAGLPLDGEGPAGTEANTQSALSVSLKGVAAEADILERYRETPVADWLRYHNLRQGPRSYESPKLLVVTCMDYRIHLSVPERFSYVLRLAGANPQHGEFDLACALAFAGLRHVCLVGHTDCAMESLNGKREAFISGMEKTGGWSESSAEVEFGLLAARFAIANVMDFTLFQAAWLEKTFPEVLVAPLIYDVKDGLLYQIVRQA